MVKHSPEMTNQPPLLQLEGVLNVTLDAYKHGEISQAEALGRFERAAALLVDAFRSNFLVRLHNLEAFRASKGTSLPAGTAE